MVVSFGKIPETSISSDEMVHCERVMRESNNFLRLFCDDLNSSLETHHHVRSEEVAGAISRVPSGPVVFRGRVISAFDADSVRFSWRQRDFVLGKFSKMLSNLVNRHGCSGAGSRVAERFETFYQEAYIASNKAYWYYTDNSARFITYLHSAVVRHLQRFFGRHELDSVGVIARSPAGQRNVSVTHISDISSDSDREFDVSSVVPEFSSLDISDLHEAVLSLDLDERGCMIYSEYISLGGCRGWESQVADSLGCSSVSVKNWWNNFIIRLRSQMS